MNASGGQKGHQFNSMKREGEKRDLEDWVGS